MKDAKLAETIEKMRKCECGASTDQLCVQNAFSSKNTSRRVLLAMVADPTFIPRIRIECQKCQTKTEFCNDIFEAVQAWNDLKITN